MAKSKADYQAEGAAKAQAELATGANPHCIALLVPHGTWQRDAFANGFNAVIGDARVVSVRDHLDTERNAVDTAQRQREEEAERQADIAMAEDRPTEYFRFPADACAANARYSHIGRLREDAARETNPRRRARLLDKANAIMRRMGAQAIA